MAGECRTWTGGSISFQSGFLAKIKSVRHSGMQRGHLVCSDNETTSYVTKYPLEQINPGQLIVEMYLPEGSAPPIGEAPETVTLTCPLRSGDSSAASLSCSGFLTEVDESYPHDDAQMGTYTLELSGTPTYTPAA